MTKRPTILFIALCLCLTSFGQIKKAKKERERAKFISSPRPPPPSESFKPQQQWAVVIGVDSYRDNRIPALACAEKDAREIANVFHRKMGFSIIGMTVATEAKLAREAGFHYSPVSLVTDYDCWKEGEEVDQEKVTATLKKNIENIRRLLVKIVPMAGKAGCRNHCPDFIKTSVLTHKENFPPKLYKSLKPFIG